MRYYQTEIKNDDPFYKDKGGVSTIFLRVNNGIVDRACGEGEWGQIDEAQHVYLPDDYWDDDFQAHIVNGVAVEVNPDELFNCHTCHRVYMALTDNTYCAAHQHLR